ncbi:hypothetical protein HDU92_001473 [Lobulomyces angularis]|nr:hypothetical protein HDU92_001473 [Lobulomyces angularis]
MIPKPNKLYFYLILLAFFALLINPVLCDCCDKPTKTNPYSPTQTPTIKPIEKPSRSEHISARETNWNKDVELYIHSVTVSSSILGVAFLLSGISFCFFGINYVPTTTFWTGFFINITIGYLIMTTIIYKVLHLIMIGDWIYVVILLILGLIGGFMTMSFIKIFCLLIGGLLGYSIGILLLLVGFGVLVSISFSAHIVYMLIFVTAGATIVFFHEGIVIKMGSALTGAMAIFLGLDTFFCTGFIECIVSAMTCITIVVEKNSVDIPKYFFIFGVVPPNKIPVLAWVLCVGVILFTILGLTIQTFPPKSKVKQPLPPRAALAYWPWEMVSPPSSSVPVTKSWFKGDRGTGWNPK